MTTAVVIIRETMDSASEEVGQISEGRLFTVRTSKLDENGNAWIEELRGCAAVAWVGVGLGVGVGGDGGLASESGRVRMEAWPGVQLPPPRAGCGSLLRAAH